MRLVLGIDTGGTYTDAVLLDYDGGQVLAKAKALTTRYDLSTGIRTAFGQVAIADPSQVRLVCLSTTLATNAIAEDKGARVCLLLAGYDPYLLQEYGLDKDLPCQDYRLIAGGHGVHGEEVTPLDEAAARRVILEVKDQVDAFAVSGYFGVRNPEHEKRLKALIRELTDRPVVCGHELARELHSIKRATTAALNARLVPILRELIRSVKRALQDKGIRAPLMIVKGDGSLVLEDVALERPIETVFSGPAASIIGARYLAGDAAAPWLRSGHALVVDVGGTTTDIALLHRGRPRLTARGAVVGGWRTCTRAADIRTAGIGGDSHVRFEDGTLLVGPRRAIPLCLAAVEHPALGEDLRRLRLAPRKVSARGAPADFLTLIKPPYGLALSPAEARLVEALADGPRSLAALAERLGLAHTVFLDASRLERMEIVGRVGLTPTDALHAEGTYTAWDAEAARLGVAITAEAAGWEAEELVRKVKEATIRKVALEILTELICAEVGGECAVPDDRVGNLLIRKALDAGDEGTAFEVIVQARGPLVGIGAPAGAYLPQVGEKLHSQVIIPPHAEVANAIGAAVGHVIKNVEVSIRPVYLRSGQIEEYTVHLPEARRSFTDLDQALAEATQVAKEVATRQAASAGAEEVALEVEREDIGIVSVVYLGTDLRITATGRPRLAEVPA